MRSGGRGRGDGQVRPVVGGTERVEVHVASAAAVVSQQCAGYPAVTMAGDQLIDWRGAGGQAQCLRRAQVRVLKVPPARIFPGPGDGRLPGFWPRLCPR
jgi:hypothetical protein